MATMERDCHQLNVVCQLISKSATFSLLIDDTIPICCFYLRTYTNFIFIFKWGVMLGPYKVAQTIALGATYFKGSKTRHCFLHHRSKKIALCRPIHCCVLFYLKKVVDFFFIYFFGLENIFCLKSSRTRIRDGRIISEICRTAHLYQQQRWRYNDLLVPHKLSFIHFRVPNKVFCCC